MNVTQNSERCIRMKIQQFKDITTSLQISSKICDQKNKPNSLQKVILSIGSKGLLYQLRSKSRLQPSNGIILCSAILFNNTQFWNDDMCQNFFRLQIHFHCSGTITDLTLIMTKDYVVPRTTTCFDV